MIRGTIPAIAVGAGTAPAAADEVLSVAAQALAQAAGTSPAQPVRAAPPPIMMLRVAGERR
jgi:hypothetical protein